MEMSAQARKLVKMLIKKRRVEASSAKVVA